MDLPVFTEKCPQGAYELQFEITKDMTDAAGRIHVGDLARKMQTALEKHFDIVSGLTGEQLRAQGKTLVISWTQMVNYRLPKEGEKVILRTWPGKDKMMMFSGKFSMYSAAGEPLMSTTSLFLLMDLDTRKMTDRPAMMNHLEPVRVEGELAYPKMTMPFPEEFRNGSKRLITPEEIDYNGHLNNTRYLDWAESLVDEDYFTRHVPRKVWVQYIREMKEGQTARLQYDWMNNMLMVKGILEGEDTFLLTMEFSGSA